MHSMTPINLAYLEYDFLIERLHSNEMQVTMWAAYHLANFFEGRAEEFIQDFLNHPNLEVQQSGIWLAAKLNLDQFTFPIYRMFLKQQGELRRTSAVALAELHNTNANQSLWDWFYAILDGKASEQQDLEACVKALLLLNPKENWWQLEKELERYNEMHLSSLSVYTMLCRYCQELEQVSKLMEHYLVYRAEFLDLDFLNSLIDRVDAKVVVDHFRSRIVHGATVGRLYQEYLNLMGVPLTTELEDTLIELDEMVQKAWVPQIPNQLKRILNLAGVAEPASMETVILDGFQSITQQWDDTILKIQEREFHLLLSLPIVKILALREQECLNSPKQQAEMTSRLYYSALLRQPFMIQILNNLIQRLPAEGMELPSDDDYLGDSQRNALWRLIFQKLDTPDYPFHRLLPQPWKLKVTGVVPRLVQFHFKNLEFFLVNNLREPLEYSLKLFARMPNELIVQRLLQNFTPLINQYFDAFLEFIEYIADPRFIERMVDYFAADEWELYQVVDFLCHIHRCDNPIGDLRASLLGSDAAPGIRILCRQCHHSYRYHFDKIFVNQDALEQRRPLVDSDLWVPTEVHCKNCDNLLELVTEERFRTDLFAALLTARIMKLSHEEEVRMAHFKAIDFPTFKGELKHPVEFMEIMSSAMASDELTPEEKGELQVENGKLYLNSDRSDLAAEAFSQCLQYCPNHHVALFHLGTISFRHKNLYEARLYFSRLLKTYQLQEVEAGEVNLAELAEQYLEILDKRDFKRSSFKLVSN